MFFAQRTYRSKRAAILLILFIADQQWISKTYPLPVAAPAAYITSELMHVVAVAGFALYRACSSLHDSDVNRLFNEAHQLNIPVPAAAPASPIHSPTRHSTTIPIFPPAPK